LADRKIPERSDMTGRSPFRAFKTRPKIIRLTAMCYVRLLNNPDRAVLVKAAKGERVPFVGKQSTALSQRGWDWRDPCAVPVSYLA